MMRFADRNMSANAYLNEIDKNFEEFRYTMPPSFLITTQRQFVIW